MASAWSLLTLDDQERQFTGNDGYGDDLARFYRWDETVPNHRKVATGDLAVIRNSRHVLGIGWTDEVRTWKGNKDRYRCPSCSRTGFKRRARRQPQFRCASCGAEFDSPLVENLVSIDLYLATYESTWRPLDHALPGNALDDAYLKNAKQHAIRELDLDAIRVIVTKNEQLGPP